MLVWAAASGAPDASATALTAGDADVLVTDARGVIVGVGRVVAGASFELRFLEGFSGPARLTLLRPDGTTEALDVVVDGRVLVEGFDLLELLEDRVEAFVVEVNGVAVRQAERRETDGDVAEGGGSERAGPSDPGGAPGTPSAPGGPPEDVPAGPDPGGPPASAPGPRNPERRP